MENEDRAEAARKALRNAGIALVVSPILIMVIGIYFGGTFGTFVVAFGAFELLVVTPLMYRWMKKNMLRQLAAEE